MKLTNPKTFQLSKRRAPKHLLEGQTERLRRGHLVPTHNRSAIRRLGDDKLRYNNKSPHDW